MLKNYLKVAFRNIFKNRVYVLINILGMGVAISFCLTIYNVFAFNNEFDVYYKDSKEIFRVHEFKENASGEMQRFELAPNPMGPRMAVEIAGIEEQTRYTTWGENIKHKDDIFRESIAYVDTNFFNMFDIKLAYGNIEGIDNRNAIFLSHELAEKLFGEDNAMGSLITIHYPDKRFIDFKVAGVFDPIPLNSSFNFSALTQFDNFLYGHKIPTDDWTAWQQTSMYLKLSNNADPVQVEKSLQKYVSLQNEERPEWKVSSFELVEFRDADKVQQGVLSGSNADSRLRKEVPIIFGSMALLILLIACFNLANTTIALMSKRVREIGVRKVMGGGSHQIFLQFLLEMAWTSLMSLLVGLALYRYMRGEFFTLWDVPIEQSQFSLLNMGMAIAALFLLVTFISGFYPALYSKKFQPAVIFRNQIKLKSSGIVSRLLNGLQFVFSIIVLIAGIAFTQNADFIKNLDVGYDDEGLTVVRLENPEEYSQLLNKIGNHSDITAMAGTVNHFGFSYEDTFLKMDTGDIEIRSMHVGDNYLNLLKLKLMEGRYFQKNLESDYLEGVIVNQAYVERFGIRDPIGELVNLENGKRYIVGVVGNIVEHIWSDDILKMPKIYIPVREEESNLLLVKSSSEKQEAVFQYLAESWKEIIPDRPFSGRYQNDVAFGIALHENNNMKTIFFALAILGGLLSLIGIFALSSLNVSRRFKEIGIRKVMGASSRNILWQINLSFFWVLLISSLIGAVLGYFLTSMIMSVMYAYFITISIVTLVVSGLAILSVAMLTTSSTIISAANTNPAYILRDE
jgi:ABC-type antimicrobial peptide transport system permease subunit